MSNQIIEKQKQLVEFINQQYDLNRSFNSRINQNSEDIDYLKNKTEISTSQAKELTLAVKRKVMNLIDTGDYSLIKRRVFSDCWRYLRIYGAGIPYTTTTKENFKDVLDALKDYNPDLEMIKGEYDMERKKQLQNDERLREVLGYRS